MSVPRQTSSRSNRSLRASTALGIAVARDWDPLNDSQSRTRQVEFQCHEFLHVCKARVLVDRYQEQLPELGSLHDVSVENRDFHREGGGEASFG